MKEIVKRIKKKRAQGDIFVEYSEVTLLKYKANKCKEMNEKRIKGIGVRVIKKNKVGFAATSNISRIEETVDTAIEMSEYGERVKFKLPKKTRKISVMTEDERVKKLTPSKMRRLGDELRDQILEIAPDITLDINIKKVIEKVELLNTEGLELSFDISHFTLNYSGMMVKGKNIIFIGDFTKFTGEKRWSVKPLVNRFKEFYTYTRKSASVKTKKYTVIVHPFAMESFLLPLFVGMNGRNFEKKTTPLLRAEGKKIASEVFTAVDDPFIPYGMWSAPFDGDGVEKKKMTVIENGVFKNFIFDLTTASKTGRKTTGHASRNYSTLPAPAFSNFVIEPGKRTVKDIIKDIDEGIYILGVLGAGQSNIMAGDFSMEIGLGFYIKDGEIQGRIKKTMVSGNIYNLLPRIQEIARDPMEIPGYSANLISPAMVFDGVNITSSV